MKRVLFAAVITASLMTGTSALAQSLPPSRLGVLGGVSFATLGGADVNDANTRTGFVGGVSLTLPLRERLSLELNGLYSQKGAKASEQSESLTLKFDYIEVPILLRYDFTAEGVRPFVSGGVSLAYQTSCEAKAATAEFSAEVDCSTLDSDSDVALDVKKFDAGLAFGGGLDFPMANDRLFTLGARYVLGVTDIVKDETVRNRAWQIYAGFSFPLR